MSDEAPVAEARVSNVAQADEVIREEVVERVLASLLSDAERCEGDLGRADVNRAYFRRELSGPECAWVERQLISREIRIVEDDEDEADDEYEESVRTALGQSGVSLGSSAYLTDDEERECGRRIQLALRLAEQGGSGDEVYDAKVRKNAEAARTRFVESNLRYVWSLASKRAGRQHLTVEDIFQEGVVGLMRAANHYDPELGFRFKTYATWWVRQCMHRAIDDGDRTVRLPVHLQEKARRIRRTESRMAWRLGRTPTQAEVAKELGLDPERLAQLLWRVHATNCLEADAPLGEDFTLLSTKADDNSTSAFDSLAGYELRSRFNELLLELSAREERVLRMRFGLNGDKDYTLDAVGKTFGVTRERIRQIEAKALRKLKHPVRSKRLRGFVD
jgi:RNA polymerase primary sigma factor